MPRTLVVSTAAALLLAGPALGQTDDEARAAIEEQAARFEQAYNGGDVAAMAELYTEDAAVLPPGSARQDGREAIRGVWSGAMEQGLAELDLTVVEVYAAGDMATEVGTFTATAPGEGGAKADVAGKYIVLWRRGEDGAWRLHRDIWNIGQ